MKKKVLIIDDSKLNIQILTDILKEYQYEPFILMDSSDVLPIVREIEPDTILLDIVMPVMNGIDVCSLLKADETTREIPIIMVSSLTDIDILKKAFDAGAFDYIKKPFEPLEVLVRINSAIRFHDQQKHLMTLAMKDGITHLYNHRAILEIAEREFQKAVQTHLPFDFMMIDIDFFKRINDTFGHRAGDVALEEIGSLLMDNSWSSCTFGRYGGEEFCCILMNQCVEQSFDIAEKLRQKIESHVFQFDDVKFQFTISIGIAHKDARTGTTLNQVIKTADQQLYLAKNSGRNQVAYEIL